MVWLARLGAKDLYEPKWTEQSLKPKVRISTGHNLKWNHFDILEREKSDTHCKIKDTLLIRDLKPALDENKSSEKLSFYYDFMQIFSSVIKPVAPVS